MKKISILDPSILSYNLGNEIISESVNKFIDNDLPNSFKIKLQFTERLRKKSKKHIQSSDLTILAGTNSISSNMLFLEQFPINIFDLLTMKNILLCGVGWFQYESKPGPLNKKLLKHLLHKKFYHSVRDSYTFEMLYSSGIKNIINTSCPSVWDLKQDHLENIPTTKADNVILTLTDYNKCFDSDQKLIELLSNHYKKLFFWPQGQGDVEYFHAITKGFNTNIETISPNLKTYDNFLQEIRVDYVGNRLHAGIKAIQNGRRTHIISIDNRASEISKDINLSCSMRGDFESLHEFVSSNNETALSIPYDAIDMWKSQFSGF